jgi:dihydroorotase
MLRREESRPPTLWYVTCLYIADRQPNLVPPLTSTKAVLAYKADLESIDSSTEYLMTLYLHPEVTPAEIKKAAKAGIKGMFCRVHTETDNQGSSHTQGE